MIDSEKYFQKTQEKIVLVGSKYLHLWTLKKLAVSLRMFDLVVSDFFVLKKQIQKPNLDFEEKVPTLIQLIVADDCRWGSDLFNDWLVDGSIDGFICWFIKPLVDWLID